MSFNLSDALQASDKNYRPVSRILYLLAQVVIIYLFRRLPCGIHLPTLYPAPPFEQELGRATLIRILYVAFQHARFTRDWCYHQKPWALTPHFHPYLP